MGSSNIAGKFFRFAIEVNIGDLVLYPALFDKNIYIGTIVGDYLFEDVNCAAFPHQRPVVWKYVIGKSELSAEANNELGSARTFFRFKRHVDEVLEKISRKALRLARLLLLGR